MLLAEIAVSQKQKVVALKSLRNVFFYAAVKRKKQYCEHSSSLHQAEVGREESASAYGSIKTAKSVH